MSEDNGKEALFNMIGRLIAIVMLAIYVVRIVNVYVPFLPETGTIADIMNSIMVYAPLALVVATTLETGSKRGFVIQLVLLILCAAVVIFQFFPGVWESFTGYVGLSK